MWFRMSSSGQPSVDSAIPVTMATAMPNTLIVPTTTATTCGEKFEKFRKGSFRKKNERQRSKSPLWYKNCSVDEGNEKLEENTEISPHEEMMPTLTEALPQENEAILPLVISDPKLKQSKKTLKAIKTDPPKRKFYKNFTSSKSHEEKPPEKEKEKILLTDRKFKNNRIEKSSSKTKINANGTGGSDLEKRESIKRSARKISAPPILVNSNTSATSHTSSSSVEASPTDGGADAKKKPPNVRSHSNLNLQALVKLVSNKRFLSSEDFALLRRKSLSEAATSVIAIAANHCKPGPIALKDGSAVAKDDVSNGNVVLVKHDLKGSFCDRINNNNLSPHNNNTKKRSSTSSSGSFRSNDSVNIKLISRRIRDSDEEFYSCDEDEDVLKATSTSEAAKDIKRKSSPSLTSRVAAKITETTNNYKNRKANKTPKKKKKLAVNALVVQNKRPEYYKQLSVERLHSTSIVRQPSDRRPDVANTSINSSGNTSYNTSELQTSQSLDADTNALDAEKDTKRDRSKSKSAPVSVNRSESYKERLSHKRNRNNRRKTSDPSLSSKPNDDQPDLGLSNSNYTASSNSSLSSGGGSESPSTSMEQVGGPVPIPTTITTHISNNTNVTNQAHNSVTGPKPWVDSDDDDDLANEVDWSSNIAAEVLAALTDAEKKRQEIINEIYQTERSHVRTLKLLEGIFMRPLQECGALPHDHLHLLFPPALLSLKELHSSFEQKLKMRRIEHNHIVQHVGDLLAGMFDGQSGEELREYAAKFCARQQIALEALKEKRRKDENLQRFLTKAEANKACRRLQLKDLLPTVLQRLTKYPLLFENLYKITKRVVPDDHEEAEAVQRALDYSKRILVDVNQAVKTAEDAHKLQTIQRKLDRSTFDKEEFRNLDLTQLKLIHDGSLTMKKNPGTQLHGLLFENMMLLLTKQDDKYALKNFQNISATGTTEVNKFISPITCFDQQTLVRQSAVDKNTFFLIITKTSQMLELRAPSSSECKTWFKHISDAAEQYKQRSKSSHEVVDDPASATLPHSNTKESLESTPERQTPSTATAIATSGTTTTTNNNISDRESTPAPDKNRTSLPNNNNSLDIGGGGGSSSIGGGGGSFASGSRSRSISCSGSRNESNNNDYDSPTSTDDTKLRQQLLSAAEEAAAAAVARRDNSSLYSNNSNNTRTLMQNSPLVEPSAIQISISPAHTAEPVLTPSERLKRLDSSIRENLVEKQKIICDMFRLPIEHFNEIVDIAAQPEAPKDSSDIALAAYAQVQSLTEVLNDYMKINSTEQEISAVSTVVCDQCHQTQAQKHLQSQLHHLGNAMTASMRPVSPLPLSAASTNTTGTTVVLNDTAPSSNAPAIPASPAVTSTSNNILTTSNSVEVDQIIHEDDDGYCEIDELRLPSVPLSKIPAATTAPGSGTFKAPLPIGVAAEIAATRSSTTPELIKRQSTISTDSIPEESEHDMTQLDEPTLSSSVSLSKTTTTSSKDEVEAVAQKPAPQLQHQQSGSNGSIDPLQLDISSSSSLLKQRNYTDDSLDSEHIEINDAYDTMTAVNKLHNLTLNDGNTAVGGGNHQCTSSSPGPILCGPNRLLHANSLEPSVPCHLINGIVTTLNSQISLLLPKINERDLERERLRRENQHLRELLNAMHERQRVEANMETPAEITKSADASNEIITPALGEEHKTTTDQTP